MVTINLKNDPRCAFPRESCNETRAELSSLKQREESDLLFTRNQVHRRDEEIDVMQKEITALKYRVNKLVEVLKELGIQ